MTDQPPPRNAGNDRLLAVIVLLLSIVVMGICVSKPSPPPDPATADAGRP